MATSLLVLLGVHPALTLGQAPKFEPLEVLLERYGAPAQTMADRATTAAKPRLALNALPPAKFGAPAVPLDAEPRVPPAAAAAALRPAGAKGNVDKPKAKDTPAQKSEDTAIRINTKPPTADELFRLETEQQLRGRFLSEAKQSGIKLKLDEFPARPVQPLPYRREFPEQTAWYEPNRLCYGRLFFEQRATERYGTDLRSLQPLTSAGRFCLDLGLWPLKIATLPWCPLECNDEREMFSAGWPFWDRPWLD